MSVKLLKNHRAALVIAAMSGVIVGLPHLLTPRWISPAPYDPLQFSYGKGSSITMEEIYTYAPEVREILERSRFVSDSQVYEYRNRKTPFIGETADAWIVAFLARLSGSLEGGFIASDFVFPSLTFLLVYSLVLLLMNNKTIAAGAAATAVLWTEFIALIPYPQAIRTSFLDAFHPRDFLIMSRSFHPQVSFPLYVLAIILVIVAVKKKRWWVSVVTGVVGGFLFYTYVFTWTAFLAGFGLFGITVLMRRQSGVLKHLVFIIAVMSVIATPYVDTVRKFQQNGLASDFFQKLSLPKRGFSDLVARHVVFLGFYILVRRKRWSINDWLLLSFWIAPLVLPNLSQEILGRDLEGKHWIRRIAYPMSTIGLGMIAISVLPKKLSTVGTGVFLFAVLSRGAILQYTMSRQSAFTYRLDEQKQDLFSWINIHTPPGTVIASLDWEMIASLPAKTHAFNFSPIGMRTIAPIDEMIERFLWAAAIYGAPEEYVSFAFSDPRDDSVSQWKEVFQENPGVGITRTYYFTYSDDEEEFGIPVAVREQVVGRYKNIKQRLADDETPPFRLDYIVIGQFEKKILSTNFRETIGQPIFSNSSFEVWKFALQNPT